MLDYCLSGTFDSLCQEPNVVFRYYKGCCRALFVSCIAATVATFPPGARNQSCHSDLVQRIALCYWCPVSLPQWLLSILVPGTKCATHLFPSVLLSGICMLGHYLFSSLHSLCQESNVLLRYYKASCPALLVSCINATMATFIPGARNEMCHPPIRFCVAVSYLYP